jgi:hypothetical protein
MIKHIVMWKMKEQAEGASKAENIVKIRAMLEALVGLVPGLLHVELGENFADSPAAADMVLYSEIESREALPVYQQHPEHVKVAQFIGLVTTERQVVDYDA